MDSFFRFNLKTQFSLRVTISFLYFYLKILAISSESIYDSEIILESGVSKLSEEDWRRVNWLYCDKGYYITGLRGQFEGDKKQFLVGLELFCGIPGTKKVMSTIGSHDSNPNESLKKWTRNYFCEGPATGFQIQTKKKKTQVKKIENIRLICSNFNESIQPDLLNEKADWRNKRICHSDQGICGVQVKPLENSEGIQNVRFKCCTFESEADYCIPYDKWELLFTYNNLDGLQPASYSYTKKVGISYTVGYIEVQSGEVTLTGSLGVGTQNNQTYQGTNNADSGGGSGGMDSSGGGGGGGNPGGTNPPGAGAGVGPPTLKLKAKFDIMGRGTVKTNYDWSIASSDTFADEKSSQISLEIGPGYLTEIWQVVGVCGGYTVRPDKIFQTGYFSQERLNRSQRLGYERLSMKDKLAIMASIILLMATYSTFV